MPPTAQFDFPGVQKVLSFSYTCSLGISPGLIMVAAVPAVTPAGTESIGPGAGDFRFSDGVTGATVRDCRLAPNGFDQSQDAAGRVWNFRLHDRRWRWEEGYAIDGEYNQLDDHKKLIPWTVRSPFQLACLLLDKMGEVGYSVDMPAGLCCPTLPGTVGPGGPGDVLVNPSADYLALGQNLPATNTNPRVEWQNLPAARALANLCAEFGRVVVYNPIGDQVSIQQFGTGSIPPPGPVLNLSPGIDPPRVPAEVIARGAPTRFQVRLAVREVARDWDDSWQPLAEASYAPAQRGQRMTVVVFNTDFTINGVPLTTATFEDMADLITGNTDPRLDGKLTASVVYDSGGAAVCLEITAVEEGYEFDPQFGEGMVCTAGPAAPGRGFAFVGPRDFSQVVSTPQRTFQQNRELALASVWSCYQVVAVDPADPTKPGIPLPGGGRLFNRFLAVLQNSRPEQIVPRPGDENRIDPMTQQPFAAEVYNGYSKDRAPAAFGSLSFTDILGGNWADGATLVLNNTPKRSPLYAGIEVVDAARQVVRAARPLYRVLGRAKARRDNARLPAGVTLGDACVLGPGLVIETGVTLLDPATYAPVRYTYTLPLPGGTAPARTISVPEAQADIIGVYDDKHNLTGVTTTDRYAENCAAQQALATAATYQTGAALAAEYPGIVLVALSGLTHQVSWQMSAAGFFTTASVNSEHSTVVPPYPQRRQREGLPPDPRRAAENLASFRDPANALRWINQQGG